jgi:hypothetical protein
VHAGKPYRLRETGYAQAIENLHQYLDAETPWLDC